MVRHLTLPGARLKLKCAEGIHGQLSPSNFIDILTVAASLNSTPKQEDLDQDAPLSPLPSTTVPDLVLDSAAPGEDDVQSASVLPLPDRVSLELTLDCGPLTLALSDKKQNELITFEISGLKSKASVYPYHSVILVQVGHMIAHDQFVLTHELPSTGSDIKPFTKLLDSN